MYYLRLCENEEDQQRWPCSRCKASSPGLLGGSTDSWQVQLLSLTISEDNFKINYLKIRIVNIFVPVTLLQILLSTVGSKNPSDRASGDNRTIQLRETAQRLVRGLTNYSRIVPATDCIPTCHWANSLRSLSPLVSFPLFWMSTSTYFRSAIGGYVAEAWIKKLFLTLPH